MEFATYVVSISGVVRIHDLERHISASYLHPEEQQTILELTNERWVLEPYRMITETLQSIVLMLMIAFVATLIAYVLMRRSH